MMRSNNNYQQQQSGYYSSNSNSNGYYSNQQHQNPTSTSYRQQQSHNQNQNNTNNGTSPSNELINNLAARLAKLEGRYHPQPSSSNENNNQNQNQQQYSNTIQNAVYSSSLSPMPLTSTTNRQQQQQQQMPYSTSNNNSLMSMHNHEPMSWIEQQKMEARELRNQPALSSISRNRNTNNNQQMNTTSTTNKKMMNANTSNNNSFSSNTTTHSSGDSNHQLFSNVLLGNNIVRPHNNPTRSVSSASNNKKRQQNNNNNNSSLASIHSSASSNSFVTSSAGILTSKKYAPMTSNNNSSSHHQNMNENLQTQFVQQEENEKLRAEIQQLRQQLLQSQNREKLLQESLQQQGKESGRIRGRQQEHHHDVINVDAMMKSRSGSLHHQNQSQNQNKNVPPSTNWRQHLTSSSSTTTTNATTAGALNHNNNSSMFTTATIPTTTSSVPSILQQMQHHPQHKQMNENFYASSTTTTQNNNNNSTLGNNIEYTVGPAPSSRTKVSPAPVYNNMNNSQNIVNNAMKSHRQGSPAAFWSKHHKHLTEGDVDDTAMKVYRMAKSEERFGNHHNHNNTNNGVSVNYANASSSLLDSGNKWAHLNKISQQNAGQSQIPAYNTSSNTTNAAAVTMLMNPNSRTGSPTPLNPMRGPLTTRFFTFSGFHAGSASRGETTEELKQRLIGMVRAVGDNSSVVECGSDRPPPDHVTHVVVPDRPQSVKALCALVTGRWVVTDAYLRESLKLGFWIDEEKFQQGAMRCLDHPFRGRDVLLLGIENKIHYDALKITIECGGGNVIPDSFTNRRNKHKYVCVSSGSDIIRICEEGLDDQ